MIKIGKAYFDTDFRWGIYPACADDDRYIVSMQNGLVAEIIAKQEEIESSLREAGFLEDPPLVCATLLTADEEAELLECYEAGYAYLVKDFRRIVFAFKHLPEQVGSYWGDPENANIRRLTEWYGFLEEDVPQSIEELLPEPDFER